MSGWVLTLFMLVLSATFGTAAVVVGRERMGRLRKKRRESGGARVRGLRGVLGSRSHADLAVEVEVIP